MLYWRKPNITYNVQTVTLETKHYILAVYVDAVIVSVFVVS